MNDFTQFVDLAAERLGGRVIAANDEFFGPKESLVKQSEADFCGEVHRPRPLDGRLGNAPPPHAGLRLVHHPAGLAGNFARRGSGHQLFHRELSRAIFAGGLRAARRSRPDKEELKKLQAATAKWTELLPETELKGDSQNPFAIAAFRAFHAHTPENLSRWWRRAAASSWGSSTRRGANRQRRVRSGRSRKRRATGRVQRPILQRAIEPADAGTRQGDERRLGDAPPSRAPATIG